MDIDRKKVLRVLEVLHEAAHVAGEQNNGIPPYFDDMLETMNEPEALWKDMNELCNNLFASLLMEMTMTCVKGGETICELIERRTQALISQLN